MLPWQFSGERGGGNGKQGLYETSGLITMAGGDREKGVCGLGAALGHSQPLGCFVKLFVVKLLSPSRYVKKEKLCQ